MTKPSGVRGHRHWYELISSSPCEDSSGIIAAVRTNISWNFYLVGLDLKNPWSPGLFGFLLRPKFSHVFQKIHLCCCCNQLVKISWGKIVQLLTNLHLHSPPPTYLLGHFEPLTGSRRNYGGAPERFHCSPAFAPFFQMKTTQTTWRLSNNKSCECVPPVGDLWPRPSRIPRNLKSPALLKDASELGEISSI